MRLLSILVRLVPVLVLNSCSSETVHHMEKNFFEKYSHLTVASIFPSSVRDIERMTEDAICLLEEEVDAIVHRPVEEQRYVNLLHVIDYVATHVAYVASRLEFVTMVSSDESMRNAAQDGALRIGAALVDVINGNKSLYLMVRAYNQDYAAKENLDFEQARFLKELLRDFERGGLALPEKSLARVNALRKDIQRCALEFDLNINKDVKTFVCTPEQLAGLDEDFITQVPRDDTGMLHVKLDMSTYSRIREHCAVTKTREACWALYMGRAYPQNYELLRELATLRAELARELGFASYAELETDNQMAKNPRTVSEFLATLGGYGSQAAHKEFATWAHTLPEGIALKNGCVEPWDWVYLVEMYKKRALLIDQQEIKNYFPVQRTVDEMLSLYEQFLGVEFRQEGVEGLWHETVRYIGVYRSGQLLGHLLLDLYPRDFKYTHACQIGLSPALVDSDGSIIPAVVAIVANFPKPSFDGMPALLSFDEVKTFFHEFGHAMHSILGATRTASFSGTNVPRDFVEVPSQMFEEWLHEPAVLKRLSCHVRTGEPLPEETIAALCRLRAFGMGCFIQRQIAFAQTALQIFGEQPIESFDQLHENLLKEYMPHLCFDSRDHSIASFGHLSGYGALYYSYLWSKVYAVILFSFVKKRGLFDPSVGERLVQQVLGRGGTADPYDMLIEFCGEKPDIALFFKELDLA